MKVLLGIAFLLFMYLRRPINLLLKNARLNYLMTLYNSYRNANTREAKEDAFEKIARNRPLSNDLIGSLNFRSPTYTDFHDEQKIIRSYLRLNEAFDHNLFWAKKYLLNPKYFVKDIFYIPASMFGFLLNQRFSKIPSFLFSVLGWIATILISAYAAELKSVISAIIGKFT